MSVISWLTPRGDLGTVSENSFYSYQLQAVDSDEQPLFYSFISGTLPGGMYVTRDGELRGIPTILSSVNQTTASTFTVRATNPNGNVADRSFSLTVSNINGPQILPKPDLIGAWFDGNFLDYTFTAVNDNPEGIQTWSIIDGTLPPGVTLSSNGRLSGYVSIIAANVVDLGFEAAPVESVIFDALPESTDRFYNFTIQVNDDFKFDTYNVRLLIVSKSNFTADNDITLINNTFIRIDADNKYRPIILNTPDSLPVLVSGSWFAYKFLAYDPEDEPIQWAIDELAFSGMDDQDAALNQTILGNGTSGPYTLTTVPANAARITVQVNDALYTAYDDYTVSVDQLTLEFNSLTILSATSSAGFATLTFATQSNPPFPLSSTINVSGITGTFTYNGTFTVTGCTKNSVTYELSAAGPGIITTTALSLLTATCTEGLATLTFATQAEAPYVVGAVITVAGVTGVTSYNGTFTVAACTTSSVSYTLSTVAAGTTTSATVTGTVKVESKKPGAGDVIFVQYISVITGYDTILFDQGASGPPAGITIDADTGWAMGTLPDQVDEFTTYEFDVYAQRTLFPTEISDKVRFSLTVKRTINEEIVWTSPFDLGFIDNGDVSEISVNAYHTLGKDLEYRVIYAPFRKLPQGLKFLRTGKLIGRTSFRFFVLDGQSATLNITSTQDLVIGMTVQGTGVAEGCRITAIVDANTIEVSPAIYVEQGTILIFSNDQLQKAASTTSNSISTVVDGGRTTFDQQCGFTIIASSIDGSVASRKNFTIRVRPRNLAPYENVYFRALPSYNQRLSWENISNDQTVFPQELIYRPEDSYFGVQKNFKTLFLSGLNPGTAENFVSAIERNHYFKKINFGKIKTARAVNADGSIGYEVLYVDLVDDQAFNTNGPPLEIVLNIANDYLFNNQSYNIIYPNSFPNMQKRLENGIGYTNRSTLPRWMTSVQEDGTVLGLIRCVVLAYTKPGAAKLISYRLQKSNFEINQIPFVADRYQWDNYLSKFYNTETNSFEPSIPTTFDKYPNLAEGTATVSTLIVNSVTNSNVITIPSTIRVGAGWEVLSLEPSLVVPTPTFVSNLNLGGNVLTLTSNISASAGSLIKIRGEAFVDYAVSNPYDSINGENLDTVRTLLLMDGVANFLEGEKLIFAKQSGYGIPNNGWLTTQGDAIPGYLDKVGFFSTINYQGGVWEITWEEFPEPGLDGDELGFDEVSETLSFSHFDQGEEAEVKLIFTQEIILNQLVKVRTGDTYKATTLQYKTVEGEAIPRYFVAQLTASGFERTAETTFDGGTCVVREGFEPGKSFAGGTTFSNNQDIWIVPESLDKYIKFPQDGVFV